MDERIVTGKRSGCVEQGNVIVGPVWQALRKGLAALAVVIVAAVAPLAVATQASAQVVITEVFPGENWIELQNRGGEAVSLAGWSMFSATTSGTQGSWWPFPGGTSIEAGAFLRVHWFAGYLPQTDTDVYTSTAFDDFLFGLGGTPIRSLSGALGLFSTQDGALVSAPASHVDWVTWGLTAPSREEFAIAAGLWLPNTAVPAPSPLQSIALATDPTPEPTTVDNFFTDGTPSPGAATAGGESVSRFGYDCAIGLANAPTLDALGVPIAGNPAFRLRVQGTSAALGEQILILISFAQGSGATLPIPQFSCPFWVDLGQPFFVTPLPPTPGQTFTDLPFSLENMTSEATGLTIYTQALITRTPASPTDQSASAGLTITFGG